MAASHDPLALYLHLASASQRRQRLLVRDKMLVLAAVEAAERSLDQIAAHCRLKILSHNAAHLVSHYPTIAAALADERFQSYFRRLKRNYSVEKAEHMLSSLGIDPAGERGAFLNDHEYAASLLGTTPEALDRQFGENGTHLEGGDLRSSELVPPLPAALASANRRWVWQPARVKSHGYGWLIATIAALLMVLIAMVAVAARLGR